MGSKLLKFAGTVLVLLIFISAAAVAYFFLFLPASRPAPDIEIVVTAATIERGRYLSENVIMCNGCHSERDWNYYGGPVKPPVGGGRACMTRDKSVPGVRLVGNGEFPGVLCMRNITPDTETGIGAWTDGEIIRSIREGVNRDGEGLFPIMPYFIFRDLSDADTEAIVAYMRSLDPVRETKAERTIDFPLNILVQVLPEPLEGAVPDVDRNDTVAYGKYLATIGRCQFCHTPREGRGNEGISGKDFAGGVPFGFGDQLLYSSNLTFHETGLAGWSRTDFIDRFKRESQRRLAEGDNTLMDWNAYSGMSAEDLGAIYDYLQTLPPVAFEPQPSSLDSLR